MMKLAAALFVGLCLTSCSALGPTTRLSDPQLIRVPGATRYIPVPVELTDELPAPNKPVPLCVDITGWPVLCDFQIALWIRSWEAFRDRVNADRAATAALPLASPVEGTPAGQ
jgi:hypothetical protein